MSRQKKTRRLTDIMPLRKADRPLEPVKASLSKKRKPTRYELDLQAKEAKKKRKHKGLPAGTRTIDPAEQRNAEIKVVKDARIGSKKKVPLVVEWVNRPETKPLIKPVVEEKPILSPELELAQLENNECLNQLLDELEAGKTLSDSDQKFVDECLDRVHELMEILGIEDEEESEDDLLRQFETFDINRLR